MSGEGPLSGIPFKVLLFDDLLGVVTSHHVTKMAVIPFDLPLPKISCYTLTSGLYLL